MPFDTNVLINYLAVIPLQYKSVIDNFSFVAALISLGVGVVFLGISLAKDAQYVLETLDQSVKDKRNPTQIFRSFVDFIEAYSIMNQLSV